MFNPNLMFDYAKIYEQEYLREAEAARLYMQLKGSQPGLLERVGHRLLAASRWLRTATQAHSATPVFDKK